MITIIIIAIIAVLCSLTIAVCNLVDRIALNIPQYEVTIVCGERRSVFTDKIDEETRHLEYRILKSVSRRQLEKKAAKLAASMTNQKRVAYAVSYVRF